MQNNNNSLVIASFKDIKGDVIKTTCFNKTLTLRDDMIPETATSYYLYTKKDDGKFSNDSSCQLGMSLKDAIGANNAKLLAFLSLTEKEYAYLNMNEKEYIILVDNDTKFVGNFEEFVESFKNDVENLISSDKQVAKKM